MKAGTTQTMRIALDVDLSYVDSIIFTIDGAKRITKIYPSDVVYKENKFEIPFTQQETFLLSGEKGYHIFIEAQINFLNKAVAKSVQENIYIADSLATVFIDGNVPDGIENLDVDLKIEGTIVYAGTSGGTSDYNNLENKPQINGHELQGDQTLSDLGIDTAINQEVVDYVEEHKAELKGDPGEPGQPGKDGEPGKNGEPGKDLIHQGEVVDEGIVLEKVLLPNILYLVKNPVEEITIQLPDYRNFFDEYSIVFTTSQNGCSLNMPEDVHWYEVPSLKANTYYECSILNNMAVISPGLAVKE